MYSEQQRRRKLQRGAKARRRWGPALPLLLLLRRCGQRDNRASRDLPGRPRAGQLCARCHNVQRRQHYRCRRCRCRCHRRPAHRQHTSLPQEQHIQCSGVRRDSRVSPRIRLYDRFPPALDRSHHSHRRRARLCVLHHGTGAGGPSQPQVRVHFLLPAGRCRGALAHPRHA